MLFPGDVHDAQMHREAVHSNLSPKQLPRQDTAIGTQRCYLKSVQTPQPTRIMALAAGKGWRLPEPYLTEQERDVF